MNDDILKLYKSIGQNQDVSTSMTPNKSNTNRILFNNNQESTLEAPTQSSLLANDSKLAKYQEHLQQQLTKANPKHVISANNYVQHLTQSLNSFKRQTDMVTENLAKRKREKCSKGLRHFSMKVCEKVKLKGVTTYNEVADELVHEYCNSTASDQTPLDYWSYDQKNVRRRVYDALNVLMAMNIISKEKKEIKWIGLPCNKKQECQELELEKQKKIETVKLKCEQLKDLLLEQIAFKALIERNIKNEDKKEIDEEAANNKSSTSISIPFILVNTDKKTVIDCNISSDKKDYLLNLDNTFEINTHVDLLKRMGLTMGLESGKCENQSHIEKACQSVPKLFEPYIKQMATSNELKPITSSILSLPNFKNLAKNNNKNADGNNINSIGNRNSRDDLNDLNDNGSIDDRGDYSVDSDQSDSDDNSLADSSS